MSKYRIFNLSSMLTTAFYLILTNELSVIACPTKNIDRLDLENLKQTRIVRTNTGTYACWWDRDAAGITFQGTDYQVAIRCSQTLIVYTHLDTTDDVVIDSGGQKRLYQAQYLGDRYKCDGSGETMIKQWNYQSELDSVQQIYSIFHPYKY